MDLFEPLSRATPAVLLLWLLLATVLLCTTAVGCCRAFAFLRRHRREQQQQLGSLRIRHMLRFLGVGNSRYLFKTDAPRVEIQLARCRNCRAPDTCDAFLDGERRADPVEFCPNYRELVELSPEPPVTPHDSSDHHARATSGAKRGRSNS